jgi:uncharacterized protein VirK/YbjX
MSLSLNNCIYRIKSHDVRKFVSLMSNLNFQKTSKEPNSPFEPSRFDSLQLSVVNPKWVGLIIDISRYCYPNEPLKRFKLFCRSLFWSKISGAWYLQISRSELLARLVQQERVLATKLHRHILRLDNPIKKRAKLLFDHYSCIEHILTPELLCQALLNGGLLLSRIEIAPEHCFELYLGFSGYPGKEGELSFYWQQRGDIPPLARVSFSIILKGQDKTIYIGGLQGAHGESARERVGTASKLCSGLSPKRAVMESVFAFANCIKATAILAVSDEQQISRKKVSKHFSYDNFWHELGAERNAENDYSLPLQPIRKEIFNAPTKRRAKYRRQHTHLDAIYRDTMAVINNALTNQQLM